MPDDLFMDADLGEPSSAFATVEPEIGFGSADAGDCCDACRQQRVATDGLPDPAGVEAECADHSRPPDVPTPTGWVIPEFLVPGSGGGGSRLVVVTATGSYTAGASDGFLKADASAGAVTVSLPAAQSAGSGKLLTVKKIDSSTNLVFVDGSGSETIDGLADLTLRRQYEAVTLVCDGTAWWIQSHST